MMGPHSLSQPASQSISDDSAPETASHGEPEANRPQAVGSCVDHEQWGGTTKAFKVHAAELVLSREPPDGTLGRHPALP